MNENENNFTPDNENVGENQPAEMPERVKYDSFMYEPIGFEEPADEGDILTAGRKKKKSGGRETAVVVLFAILVIFTMALGIAAILYDVFTGPRRLEGVASADKVVIYQSGKPKDADDLTEYKDEHGRFSTEGCAKAVRGSIVEIYTYADPTHKTLLGTGSGVVLNTEGYIVTNAHVLQSDGYHDVHASDGKVYPATIVGRDSKTDLAVLLVKNANLEPAVLGDSDEVVVGEKVIAIGNPAGLTGSVTDGIVSAVNRKIKSDQTGFEMNCIQTDAAISPGNSGGALVNMFGQVIGITSSKYRNGYYEGLGFAITINEVKPIIEELINNGYMGGRFRIGITLISMDSASGLAAIEEKLGFELPEGFKGIYIDDIAEDCDIANTDLVPGDFITKIHGIPISTYSEMYNAISAQYGAGDRVPATCAHVSENGKIDYYDIEFMLMEDTSGDY